MSLKFMGKKIGMTRIFDEKGDVLVCTVIAMQSNIVTQVKTLEKDGYTAIQLGAHKVSSPKLRNVTKPLQGHFSKAGVEPQRDLLESRLEAVDGYAVGQEVPVSTLQEYAFVDVSAVSKGKGHQGVIKRHHFAGGPAAHGSGFHRHGGSCGMRSSPGRCLPGQKKSGRMGGERVTTQNLKVVKVDAEQGVVLVEGSVPGPRGGLIYLSKAKKKVELKK